MIKQTLGKSRRKTKSRVKSHSPTKVATKKVVSRKKGPPRKSVLSAEDRYRKIAEIAYYISERRGFESGHEFEDWLRAEAEFKLNENIKKIAHSKRLQKRT